MRETCFDGVAHRWHTIGEDTSGRIGWCNRCGSIAEGKLCIDNGNIITKYSITEVPEISETII